jgi:hypothetical protein
MLIDFIKLFFCTYQSIIIVPPISIRGRSCICYTNGVVHVCGVELYLLCGRSCIYYAGEAIPTTRAELYLLCNLAN